MAGLFQTSACREKSNRSAVDRLQVRGEHLNGGPGARELVPAAVAGGQRDLDLALDAPP